MKRTDDFDRTLTAWLNEAAPQRVPEGIAEAVATAVGRRRPKRRLVALLTEPPIRRAGRIVVGAPAVRGAYLVGLAILLLSLAAAAIAVGSRLLPTRSLPPPFGPAGNGLIAFDTHAAVLVANADGSGVRPLVSDLPGASSATWSPDGTKLAFYSEPPEVAPTELWVVDADGTHLTRLAADLWMSSDKRPSWSPDGRQLVVSAESGPNRNDERLYIVSVDGGEMRQLGQEHPQDPIRRLLPAWSPDGQWIAFQGIVASKPLPAVRLYLIRPDGRDERLLPTAGRYGFDPPGAEWLGDPLQEKLVYSAGETEDARDIYAFDVEAGRETRISAANTWEFGPAWSPDGGRIAWYDTGDSRGPVLKIANAAGNGGTTTLSGRGIGAAFVHWSPDGARLYGASLGNTAVVVLIIDGSEPPMMIRHVAGQGWPTWQRVAP
jgi:Tol biopolymer transport system component